MCISEALDFIITYCDIETDCPAPFMSAIHCINGAYFDVINNASDGAYLLYRNRTVGHLPWPPL